jgi:hypothetical protein
VQQAADTLGDAGLRRHAADLFDAIGAYEEDAAAAGPGFVEIQHTMLFATIGQRRAG